MSGETYGWKAVWNRLASHAAGKTAVGVVCAVFLLTPAGAGQATGVNQGGPEYVHGSPGSDPKSQNGTSEAGSKLDQMREAERHRRVLADAARLVELSNQLKAALDQAPKDQLSVDVLRKAAEIEKVAHDMRGWLKS